MNDKNKFHIDDRCSHDECLSGKRNRYFKGKNMTADDFSLEQRYGIDRRHLLNRAIHGWGVAHGFSLSVENGHLICSPGLALDRHGRELFRAVSGIIPAHQIKVIEELAGKAAPQIQSDSIPTNEKSEIRDLSDPNLIQKEVSTNTREHSVKRKWLLSAHYAERRIDEVPSGDSCGCGETEWNYLCETIVFSLRPLGWECGCSGVEPSCPNCGCRPPHKMHLHPFEPRAPMADMDRGPHYCLCQWLTDKAETMPGASDELCTWEGFKGFGIAVHDPVPLACVTITIDHCGHPSFDVIDDSCTPRRLIKTNDLLFDLIRGCDLTRIVDINWAEWHRKLTRENSMPWETFEHMLFPTETRKAEMQSEKRAPVTTEFWIRFSDPVDISTLAADCVTMTVLAAEDEGGWIEVRRIPITGLVSFAEGDFTYQINLCVDSGWCHDEILGHKSIFHRPKVRVEIEVRGDLILDCHGQAVDANAVGLRATPTGNGTPGGTFISTFRVAPKRETKIATDSEE